jgi:hypothetical protein
VYCIVKWESAEHQKTFEKHFHEVFLKENPEVMDEFARL